MLRFNISAATYNIQFQMDATSTPSKPIFKSHLFGSFGAGFFVPPNTIDFGSLDPDDLTDNILVLATVIGLILLYIPLSLVCRWIDKRDLLKVSLILHYSIH